MKSSNAKYYVRLMRPVFQRAILTVEASSDEVAVRAALKQAEHLTDKDWSGLEAEVDPPVVEVALSEEDAEGDSKANLLEYLSEVQHAYALLQADLEAGEGSFIAPTWMKQQPELMIADVTQDWTEALTGITEEGTQAFYDWLIRQGRPANVVDFFAERDKRRPKPHDDPDEVG